MIDWSVTQTGEDCSGVEKKPVKISGTMLDMQDFLKCAALRHHWASLGTVGILREQEEEEELATEESVRVGGASGHRSMATFWSGDSCYSCVSGWDFLNEPPTLPEGVSRVRLLKKSCWLGNSRWWKSRRVILTSYKVRAGPGQTKKMVTPTKKYQKMSSRNAK